MAQPKPEINLDKLLVLDGASGTLLENQNVTLHPKLWSAISLVTDKPVVENMHKEYYDAGANIASTVTYQASFPAFREVQDDSKTVEVMAEATQLAREAAEKSQTSQPKFVAACLGPYGAYLSQGQEYSGDYGSVTDEQLYDFHKPRYDAVAAGAPDVILFETVPTLQEVKILSKIVSEKPYPTWISFSVRSEDKVTLVDGTPIDLLVKECTAFPVVGANCFPLKDVSNVLREFHSHTSKPLIVYPNSGEIYNATEKVWYQPSPKHDARWNAAEWYDLGARVIGGCCRTDPTHINVLAKQSAAINAHE